MYNIQEMKTRVARKPVLVYGPAQREIAHRSVAVKNIQLYGQAKYQELETPVFNRKQQRLYAEVVYGITMYTEAELSRIPGNVKYDIIQRFKKAQVVLNEWKQQIVEQSVNKFLENIFPKSSTVKVFNSIQGADATLKCKLPFKELGINQQMIAEKLVSTGMLPKDFFQLR